MVSAGRMKFGEQENHYNSKYPDIAHHNIVLLANRDLNSGTQQREMTCLTIRTMERNGLENVKFVLKKLPPRQNTP